MNAALLVRIRPSGPWRFGPVSGSRQETGAIGRSDTLFGALSSAMSRLGEAEAWFDATARAHAPEIALSSAFPLMGRTHYVTPPLTLWPPASSSPRVRWKAARFIPAPLAQDLAAGRPLADDRWEVDARSGCLVPTGGTAPYRMAIRQSAAVDRLDHGRVAPHATSCLEFAPNAGLWMVVTFPNAEARSRWDGRIRAAFRLLADSGIGGERTNGWGHADTVEFQPGPWPGVLFPELRAAGSHHWLLSVFSPAPSDQVDWSSGHYRLLTRSKRGGKAVRMAEEGSVLNSPAAPVGTAREVAPDGSPHPIWRAGFAVSVPLPEVEAPRTELAIPLDVPAPPVGELLPPVMAAQDSEEPVESLEAEIEEIAPGEELPPAQTEALEAPALTESVAAEAATEGSDTVEEPAEPPQPEDVPAVVAEMASGPDACDSTAETSAGAEDAGLEAIAAGEAPAAGAPEDTALSADADGPGHAEESAQSPEAAPAPDAAEPVKQPEVSE